MAEAIRAINSVQEAYNAFAGYLQAINHNHFRLHLKPEQTILKGFVDKTFSILQNRMNSCRLADISTDIPLKVEFDIS
ncbi:MAG: hypothetical protein U9N83_20025 [Thermodesulfobacteriota bacterium]|nr:hypothetical protein [Thermodesulfobacteriota bacterium]